MPRVCGRIACRRSPLGGGRGSRRAVPARLRVRASASGTKNRVKCLRRRGAKLGAGPSPGALQASRLEPQSSDRQHGPETIALGSGRRTPRRLDPHVPLKTHAKHRVEMESDGLNPVA